MRIILWLGLISSCLQATPLKQVELANANNHSLFAQENVTLGPIIPGLAQGYTPQGLCYSATHHCFFISHYKKGTTSCVSAIDAKSQQIIATFQLYETTNQPHTGHVGGVSYYKNSLYIASEKHVLIFALSPRSSWLKEQILISTQTTKAQVSASFCSHFKQNFYVGAFTHYPNNSFSKKFTSPREHHFVTSSGKKNHALILGYSQNYPTPSQAFSIPDKTQGLIVTTPFIYLSRSYGRSKHSYLEIHRIPLPTVSPPSLKLGNATIPLHLIDSDSMSHSIKLPPMSEGICLYKNQVAILFESGAEKYRERGLGQIDRLVFYTIDPTRLR